MPPWQEDKHGDRCTCRLLAEAVGCDPRTIRFECCRAVLMRHWVIECNHGCARCSGSRTKRRVARHRTDGPYQGDSDKKSGARGNGRMLQPSADAVPLNGKLDKELDHGRTFCKQMGLIFRPQVEQRDRREKPPPPGDTPLMTMIVSLFLGAAAA